ncbi:TPM domain-containing protein [Actinoplanes friuliensis]|uniref:TPM domain-containing protein n=1 Tax=Actinoplanes friuliensis DSM 7358 TaxID=1246995 RepID=U5VRG0_9ACTN|nr:TPM domain-containing protein [Actinoplanes friuliensis]AGZ39538.1 hypothetical protein AFR_06245 [Actinoplanes friuliensis DSM 7358]
MKFLGRTAVALVALLLLAPAPAQADAPSRLAVQVTDAAGALGSRAAAVDSALAALQRDTDVQLWVIFVDSFDGTPAEQWTEATARLSDLGDSDALLAVATQDRSYYVSFPADPRFTDAELADVANRDLEPALSRGDWPGAVIAAASGYSDAANSSNSSLIWVVVIFVVILAGALIWVVLRRRRARPAPAAPTGPPTAELTASANALLIELDDDLRASESELSLATAQYGAEATAPFKAALEASRQDVAEAFRLRMTLEEVPAPDEETRRRTLTEIIAKCRAADDRLDAESEAFDRLRDLEGRAAEVATELETRRLTLEATLPAASKTLQDLTHRYAGPTVTGISGNLDQARERLQFTAEAIGRARTALPANRAEAALAVRAAEQAADQAAQLITAIDRAAADFTTARTAADALLTELESEIAAGRAALTGGSVVPPGLGSAVTGAEQAVVEVRTQLAAPKTDPVTAVATLQAADAALDHALAEAQDAAERTARARSLLAQALPVARAEVAATTDFITTRRGAITTTARASLSEAQRHLALAESLAATDPAAALTEAQQAQQLAAAAGHSAHTDVQGWGGYTTQPTGGFDAGAFAGAVLGGILSGGGRSYGGGRSGGWGGGGFGGSATRTRRTGGSSGGSARRGGGGRF